MQQSGTREALVAAPGRVAAVQAVPSPSRWELHVPRTGLGVGDFAENRCACSLHLCGTACPRARPWATRGAERGQTARDPAQSLAGEPHREHGSRGS